jgi:hypothetical protein
MKIALVDCKLRLDGMDRQEHRSKPVTEHVSVCCQMSIDNSEK